MKDLIERLLEEEIDAAAQAAADEVNAAEEEAEEATDDEPADEAGEEEVTDGLKESISGLLRDLNAMGLPINEGEVAISLYRHLENIVESAKLVGVSEVSFSQYKKLVTARNRRAWAGRRVGKDMQNKVYKVQDELMLTPGGMDRDMAMHFGKEAARKKAAIKLGKPVLGGDPDEMIKWGKEYKRKYKANRR